MSPSHFAEHRAPAVPPVRVGKRNLWDVKPLDRWLDQQSGFAHVTRSVDEWAGMIVRVKGIKRVRAKGRIYYYDRHTGCRITALRDACVL
jgi:hypothetical protein